MGVLHIPKKSGVYCFRNTINSKMYVGSAVDMRRRVRRHIRELENETHPSPHLQNAWSKYGSSNFEVSVLEICHGSDLLLREQHFLDALKVCDRKHGYNTCKTAGSPSQEKLSEETKRKIGDALRGRKFSEARKANLSLALKGRKMPPSWIESQRQCKVGKKQSEECIEKRAREYAFIDEGGTVYQGKNLKRFAQAMGCSRSNLNMVLDGKRKSHHGLKKYEPFYGNCSGTTVLP